MALKQLSCILLVFIVVLLNKPTASQGIEYDSYEYWKSAIEVWGNGTSFPPFDMNTARVTFKSNISDFTSLYWQDYICLGCELQLKFTPNPPSVATSTLYQSKTLNRFKVSYSSPVNVTICSDTLDLAEKGDYWLIVYSNTNNATSCVIVPTNDPAITALPIVYVTIIFIVLAVLWLVGSYLYRRHLEKNRTAASSASMEMGVKTTNLSDDPKAAENKIAPKKRLRSLDTFRGLSLCIMIFVNYGGGQYYTFGHAYWDGLLVADWVFAWFVFIMGASVEFAMQGMMKRREGKLAMLLVVARRTVYLFLIGLFMGAQWIDPQYMRIPGVLQRLAFTYWGCAFTHIFFVRSSTESRYNSKILSAIRDIIDYWLEWIIMFAILAFYLALTYALPLETDCPTGYVGPGGLHENSVAPHCSGGAASYIDRLILTTDHMYNYGTYKEVYQASVSHDPEGILGTFSSIFHCFIGLQIGKIVVTYKSDKSRLIRWVIWGLATLAIGLILCHGDLKGGWVPVNKNLWSISYVLIMSGAGYLILALLYVVIDVYDLWNGAPFIYPGMNSIVVYVCHSVFHGYFPVYWVPADETVHWPQLLMDLWGTAIMTFLGYVLYKKNIFVAL